MMIFYKKILKNLIIIVIIFCFLGSLFSYNFVRAENSWDIKEIETMGRVFEISFALDSKDYPHICYRSQISGFSLKNNLIYVYWNGSSWKNVTIDTSSDVGYYCSLVLDSNDIPHICYFDKNNGDLKYAYLNDTNWEIQILDSEGDVGYDCVIALDGFDNPHIVYYEHTKEIIYGLKYAQLDRNTSNWNIDIIDSNLGWDISMDFNSKNKPFITIFDFYRNQSLKYIFLSDIADIGWDFYSPDFSIENDSGRSSSISIDSNDNSHIVYIDNTNRNLKYAFFNGVDWIIKEINSNGDVGFICNLDLDEYDNPHVCYESLDKSRNIKYAYWNGFIWDIDTIDFGRFPTLDLDNNNIPHFCYIDDSIKYAFPHIKIFSPVKSKKLYRGDLLNISFTSKYINDSIRIELFNEDTYVQTIISNYNSSQYKWLIPEELKDGLYELKIISNSNDSKYATTSFIIQNRNIFDIYSINIFIIIFIIIVIIIIIYFAKFRKK
jgi:hypothetical protein